MHINAFPWPPRACTRCQHTSIPPPPHPSPRPYPIQPNREEMLTWTPEDRPLFVQFCSNDPQHLLAAARMVEKLGVCDAIDINFGCPQVGARGLAA